MACIDKLSKLIEGIKGANQTVKIVLLILAILASGLIVTVWWWFPKIAGWVALAVLIFIWLYDPFKNERQIQEKLKSRQNEINRIADTLWRAIISIAERIPMVSKPADFNEILQRVTPLNSPNLRAFKAQIFKKPGFASAPDTTEVLRKHLQNRINDLWQGDFPLVITEVSDRGTTFEVKLVYVDNASAQQYADNLLKKSEKVAHIDATDEDF